VQLRPFRVNELGLAVLPVCPTWKPMSPTEPPAGIVAFQFTFVAVT